MKQLRLLLLLLLCLTATLAADEAQVEVKTGIVVVVKPDGSPWGRKETNGVFYCVKHIKDASIKWAAKKDRDPNAHIIFPYAVRSNGVVIVESEYKIDPKADDSTPLEKNGAKFSKSVSVKP